MEVILNPFNKEHMKKVEETKKKLNGTQEMPSIKDMIEMYKEGSGLVPLKKGVATSVAFAVNHNGHPFIWAQASRFEDGTPKSWTIVDNTGCVMNKENGLFYTMTSREQVLENSFGSHIYAFHSFLRFYGDDIVQKI